MQQQKSVKCKKLLWPNSENEVEWQLELGLRHLSPSPAVQIYEGIYEVHIRVYEGI